MWPGAENRPLVRRIFFTFHRYAIAHDYVKAIDVSDFFLCLEIGGSCGIWEFVADEYVGGL